MIATTGLTAELRRQVSLMEPDLRHRVESEPDVSASWRTEYEAARKRERTAATWASWRDERVTQAAVAWVLTTVFVRFCEDNALIAPVWIGGPERRRQEALDAQREYFRAHPMDTDREWIEQAVSYLAGMPATRDLVDARSALHWVSPSGDAAAVLLEFWREREETGLVRDLTDPELSTRFLGDIYQDISESARSMYALLQTPVFVEEFILDRTMEPALAERSLEGFKLIDPTCGSGHFLLGAFSRLLDRWQKRAPGQEIQSLVQRALDAVHGVDVNPFAIAITRFRLTIAAIEASGITRLEVAPAFDYHLAAGDSLWFGAAQQTLDYGDSHSDESGLVGFAYSFEDRALLRKLLHSGQYDAVVGNPPYITVKDKALNAAYRSLYATCKGTYAMTVPFMELFFNLASQGSGARPAGWVGQITSNSFMKREFGEPLIEQFLVKQDLRYVIDTSGAFIPGHGTPTVIVVGRNSQPLGSKVRTVLGIRGEPGRPDDASQGIVWRSIVDSFDQPGHDDGWTSTSDLDRTLLAKHPWSLSGGGAAALLVSIEMGRKRLRERLSFVGYSGQTNSDGAFLAERRSLVRKGLSDSQIRQFVPGEVVRDFVIGESIWAIFPYEEEALVQIKRGSAIYRWLWPSKTINWARATFAKNTYLEEGKTWWEWHQIATKRDRGPERLVYPNVATHNHFVFNRVERLFNPHAPFLKLCAGATEDDHLGLLGVLNSSTACFWLKQNSQGKAGSGIGRGIQPEDWMNRFEFTGATLMDYPLSGVLPVKRGRILDSLAMNLIGCSPDAVVSDEPPTRTQCDTARGRHRGLRAQMIAQQEELDWDVYRLYGLIGADFTYSLDDLPKIALGERAFEIRLARQVANAEEQTAWFERHGSTPITQIPGRWPTAYQDLVQRRLDLIESDSSILLLERPEYKRRWVSEPWEKQEETALRNWLLDRVEDKHFWFDAQNRPTPLTLSQLADIVARDHEMMGVLALWEGHPDVTATASLTRLLVDESVPFLAAYRYKESGLRKRADWESTWDLQRKQDAGKDVGFIPVPPKYTSADFVNTSYWQARGKLDVQKERFISYPQAGRDTDPTAVIGWAGWDHAQQALALNLLIGQREQDGWDDERLVPLIAGLAELQPWIDQWHSDIDPAYGFSLAAFCREELTKRAQQVSRTIGQLREWRPPQTAARRGRKPKTAGATS